MNDRIRDRAIVFFVDQIVRRWPLVPKFYSSKTRHSAAWLVARVFSRHGIKLEEKRVREIYKERPNLNRRLAEFLIADLPVADLRPDRFNQSAKPPAVTNVQDALLNGVPPV